MHAIPCCVAEALNLLQEQREEEGPLSGPEGLGRYYASHPPPPPFVLEEAFQSSKPGRSASAETRHGAGTNARSVVRYMDRLDEYLRQVVVMMHAGGYSVVSLCSLRASCRGSRSNTAAGVG